MPFYSISGQRQGCCPDGGGFFSVSAGKSRIINFSKKSRKTKPLPNCLQDCKLLKKIAQNQAASKLFEVLAAGLISGENDVSFTNRYQSEQTKIQGKIAVIDTKLEQQVDCQANAEQLRQAISDYLNVKTLTSFILNKLIEKIRVGSVGVVDGEKQQEVRIE